MLSSRRIKGGGRERERERNDGKTSDRRFKASRGSTAVLLDKTIDGVREISFACETKRHARNGSVEFRERAGNRETKWRQDTEKGGRG